MACLFPGNGNRLEGAVMQAWSIAPLVLAASAFVSTFAGAADKDGYNQALASAKAQYKASEKQCGSLAGNARDVCKAEARLQRVRAEMEAGLAFKDGVKQRREAAEAIAKAEYELARERCDDKGSNLKDVCVQEAKAGLEKAQADARAYEKTAAADTEALQARRDADYKVALQKCEQLAGDAKSGCVSRAKGTFGK
jgi:hypothetical protein